MECQFNLYIGIGSDPANNWGNMLVGGVSVRPLGAEYIIYFHPPSPPTDRVNRDILLLLHICCIISNVEDYFGLLSASRTK